MGHDCAHTLFAHASTTLGLLSLAPASILPRTLNVCLVLNTRAAKTPIPRSKAAAAMANRVCPVTGARDQSLGDVRDSEIRRGGGGQGLEEEEETCFKKDFIGATRGARGNKRPVLTLKFGPVELKV